MNTYYTALYSPYCLSQHFYILEENCMCCSDKMTTQDNLWKEGLFWCGFRVQSIMEAKSPCQELEEAGHVGSTVRNKISAQE